MKKLEDIERPCSRKIEIKFQRQKRSDRLYDCEQCPGTPGSCPNYVDHKALVEKYKGIM